MIGLFLQERSLIHYKFPSWRKSFWRTHFNRRCTNSHV